MLFNELKIRNLNLKNRIVLPPMVRHKVIDNSGYVNEELIDYYNDMASTGNGLIIVEATCVSSDGKLRDNQLGLWNDTFIDGLKQISEACHQHNVPVILQLHHAGFRKDIATVSSEVLDKILSDFIASIFRAKKCGFDGIEIHAAHRYLLSQLHSKLWNTRNDKYGGHFDKRIYFIKTLIEETSILYDDNFIFGVRIGGNEPTIKDGIKLAKKFEELGASYIHVSHGIPDPSIRKFDKVEKPIDFPFNWINYMSKEIKENVSIPVIAVYEIKTPEHAYYLIKNNIADLVAIGRAQLNNTTWMGKALRYCDFKKNQNC